MQFVLTIISQILSIISTIIFFHTFLPNRKRQISNFTYALCLLSIEFITCNDSYFNLFKIEALNTLILVISGTMLTYLLTLLFNAKHTHRLFISISLELLSVLSELFIYVVIPSSQSESLVTNSANANYLWSLLSNLFLLCLILIICNLFKHLKYNYPVGYTATILITPTLSIILALIVIDYSAVQFYGVYLYKLFVILGLFTINAINYFLFNHVLKARYLEEENKKLIQQIEFQTAKYQQISTTYQNARSILHDTKKHFLYLNTCIKTANYAPMRDYLPIAIDKLDLAYNRINTGNLVIDAFISNYLKISENENIIFRTNIKLNIKQIPINDYDLCIILGNLLDNSLNAVRKIKPPQKREISVHLFTFDGNFVIHITNTLPAFPLNKPSEDTLEHGYGIKNIENATLKYFGTYSHTIENERYSAVISTPYAIGVALPPYSTKL